ncbi:H-NS family nucleoid-associated regulatory protein [Lacimicrobium alkaliphilum]|uniref:DNA-binding protein n=1 Tax=Lacimicrobium alkaliphilum TaxID=1526571 RepID=A0A0U2ZHZ2_9ALTE|nr:H-NS family nucleoid-associated regulatory protein [Lacimicrobium alkaliphilum]ALS97948.1 histone [Lacimicrobium alkaliphilum]
MSDFIKILTHARRLQAAVKELSVSELEQVSEKLTDVIEKKKQLEAEQQKEAEKKKAVRDAILKQMQEAGLDINDLEGSAVSAGKRTGQKRPIKYRYTDKDGNEHTWTGIGRTPKVFAKLKQQGQLKKYGV